VAKILSKSGDSLADVYDVDGSIAGIEDLVSRDVNLVHEMGSTIFSERLSASIFPLTSGAIPQSTAFNSALPISPTSRLLGLAVVTDQLARINDMQVSIQAGAPGAQTDIPLFVWVAGEIAKVIRMEIGGSLQTQTILLPASGASTPNLIIGQDSPLPAATFILRGQTNAFGAGTVTTQVILHIAFPQLEGLSNRGLPLPGW